jgi:hypothetical protein
MMWELDVTITCPQCGHQAREQMPTDRCVYFYDCRGCGALLKPKAGDCCVYCSYGDKRCPFVRGDSPCPDSLAIETVVEPFPLPVNCPVCGTLADPAGILP